MVFLREFGGKLSTEQVSLINLIPNNVTERQTIGDYNFGLSLRMWNDSIKHINTGSRFPASLIEDAFIQLSSTFTAEQTAQSNIDQRLNSNQ